jgi:hypothetical protein
MQREGNLWEETEEGRRCCRKTQIVAGVWLSDDPLNVVVRRKRSFSKECFVGTRGV